MAPGVALAEQSDTGEFVEAFLDLEEAIVVDCSEPWDLGWRRNRWHRESHPCELYAVILAGTTADDSEENQQLQ